MKRLLPLLCVAGMCAMAQEPSGEMHADPNPCRLEHDRKDCTVSLAWHTRGVERAKVFVVAEGRHPGAERTFSDSRNCEPGQCMASWIEPETRYTFQLVDFSHGDRGRVLASIVVTGEGHGGDRDHDGASGNIEAEPNPCHIEPGQHDCVTHLAWNTQGVRQAKVFVVAEGRHPGAEREFGTTLSCEPHKCRAPWIEPDTRYTFQLYDYSRGDRGRLLSTVVVTATR